MAVSSTSAPFSNTRTRGPGMLLRYQVGGVPDNCTRPVAGLTHSYIRAETGVTTASARIRTMTLSGGMVRQV